VRATLDFVPKAFKANHGPRDERIIVIREAIAVVGHGLSKKERSTVQGIDLDDSSAGKFDERMSVGGNGAYDSVRVTAFRRR
jgi:hypothetical protein